jgi:hypothetical protein
MLAMCRFPSDRWSLSISQEREQLRLWKTVNRYFRTLLKSSVGLRSADSLARLSMESDISMGSTGHGTYHNQEQSVPLASSKQDIVNTPAESPPPRNEILANYFTMTSLQRYDCMTLKP